MNVTDAHLWMYMTMRTGNHERARGLAERLLKHLGRRDTGRPDETAEDARAYALSVLQQTSYGQSAPQEAGRQLRGEDSLSG